MVDFLISQSGNALFVDVLWQSGLFLMVGLAASRAMRRRPARAHRVLLLAILGALIAPMGSQLVHSQGWGLWGTASAGAPTSPAPSAVVMPSPPATKSEDADAAIIAASRDLRSARAGRSRGRPSPRNPPAREPRPRSRFGASCWASGPCSVGSTWPG